jgi:hypothetical protein
LQFSLALTTTTCAACSSRSNVFSTWNLSYYNELFVSESL